jgi:hypothetical protein
VPCSMKKVSLNGPAPGGEPPLETGKAGGTND